VLLQSRGVGKMTREPAKIISVSYGKPLKKPTKHKNKGTKKDRRGRRGWKFLSTGAHDPGHKGRGVGLDLGGKERFWKRKAELGSESN